MTDHPHTITNGAGEELTFLGIETDAEGRELLRIRNKVAPGAGPPMHTHLIQEEALTVESGTIRYEGPGQDEQEAGPGETVVFAPGETHRFWNAGDDELVCTGYVSPPDNLEYFLSEIYASMERNGGERPGAFDGAYLTRRYRTEFQMNNIPGPVQAVVFPVVAALGGLLGWGKRYEDAPEPISRSDP